jgi:hypothetical protein
MIPIIPRIPAPSCSLTYKLYNVAAAWGPLETIPAKMIKDIPFPIPFSVICSPNHIKIAVPAVNVNVTVKKEITDPPSETALLMPIYSMEAWKNPSSTAP